MKPIQQLVRQDLGRRQRLGIERYGTALYPHNGRNGLLDAYEEALDLSCYLKQALIEQETARRRIEQLEASLHEILDATPDPSVHAIVGKAL